ncbi:MAG: ATP-binding domain-containing protein [Gammaproteobacteria bacterium]
MSLAYAVTIHKSQGSEYPAVVIPLATQRYTLLKRNLYDLLSPALWATVSAVGVERRGVWAPRTFPHFPEIGSAVEAASDHAAVWVDLS